MNNQQPSQLTRLFQQTLLSLVIATGLIACSDTDEEVTTSVPATPTTPDPKTNPNPNPSPSPTPNPIATDSDNDGVTDDKDAEPNNDKVVGIVEDTYHHKISKFDANGKLTSIITNDAVGLTTETRFYNSNQQEIRRIIDVDNSIDGNLDSEFVYTYDANGNQNSWTKDVNRDGTIDVKQTYQYDNNNNIIEDIRYPTNDDNNYHKKTYRYGANGNQTTLITVFSLTPNNNTTLESEYNSDNQVTKHILRYHKDTSGIPNSLNEFHYDANGNQISTTTFHNGVAVSNTKTTYNTNNQVLERSQHRNEQTIAKTTYTYNNNQQCVSATTYYSDGSIRKLMTLLYNANGQLIRADEDRNANGTIEAVFNYIYDADGYLVKENDKQILFKGTLSEDIKKSYQLQGFQCH